RAPPPEGRVSRRQFLGDDRAAAGRRCGPGLKPELGQRTADRTRFVFVAILHLADCERLPAFHLIERGFEAPKGGTDARLPPAIAALRTGRRLATWLCPRPDRAGGRRIHTA